METNRTYVRTTEPVQHDPYDDLDPSYRAGVAVAVDALRIAYECGWQPMDVVHTTSKLFNANDIHAVARLVLFEAQLSNARLRAPAEWVSQLAALEHRHGARHTPSRIDLYAIGLHSRMWRSMRMWGPIAALPSQWPASDRAARADGPDPLRPDSHRPDSHRTDSRMLVRIRGLLAKAESTDFEEEAHALTAKAQELMSRYSVTAALLAQSADDTSDSGWIRARRFHIDSPYAAEKSRLLYAIADANSCRAVIFTKYAIVEAHGSAVDIEQVDMLFTSLLVQATKAMAAARAAEFGSNTTSFRKGFLTGFAVRVGERLRAAGRDAAQHVADERSIAVVDLLPVLHARAEHLDAEFTKMYPRLGRSRARSFDGAGYASGAAAADRADLLAQNRIRR